MVCPMEELFRWGIEHAGSVAERDALRRRIADQELQRLRAELGPEAAAKIERQMLRIIEDERRKDIRAAAAALDEPPEGFDD
jgi:hypothetical protein